MVNNILSRGSHNPDKRIEQDRKEEDGTAGYEQSSCLIPGAPISLSLNDNICQV
jgi:hypothetical protein